MTTTRQRHAQLIDKHNHNDDGRYHRSLALKAMLHFMFVRRHGERSRTAAEHSAFLRAMWNSSTLTKPMKRAIFHPTKPLGSIWL